jgi:hypothetical protein
MTDWLVEYLDAHEGIVLDEVYVGLSTPEALNRRINRQLATDERLMGVLRWNVRLVVDD